MNPQLTRQDIIDIIKEFNTQQGGTTGSFSIPRHGHNGSDSLKLYMGDLLSDFRGLSFTDTTGSIRFYVDGDSFNIEPFSIGDNGVGGQLSPMSFNVGNLSSFTGIGMYSGSPNSGPVGNGQAEILFQSSSLDGISDLTIRPDYISFGSTDPDFSVNFQDVNPLPANPNAGDIIFSSSDGKFHACEVAGTWRTIVTV